MRLITNDDTTLYKGSSYQIKIAMFDSPEEFVESHEKHCGFNYELLHPEEWQGGRASVCRETLRNGCLDNLDNAKEIMSKLDISDLLTSNMPLLENDMVGFVPNVSAYIAGQPETMFTMIESEQQALNTPIRVFVETTVSAGITHEQLTQRGTSILAFVLAMNTVRPVELYTISVVQSDNASGTFGHAVRLPNPMDLSRAVWMLTNPGYARGLMFSYMNYLSGVHPYTGPWPFGSNPTKNRYTECMRDVFSMADNDIFLKGGYLFDHDMLNNPIAWVNKMVREHSNK